MGDWVQLQAQDEQTLQAYVARPEGEPKGALVVVQEIFGVNRHIQSVADRYAELGYLSMAPSLFDRYEAGVQLTYGESDRQKAFSLYGKLDPSTALLDIVAAAKYVQRPDLKTGVLGFCFGGLMAWLAATRGRAAGFQPACAVGYYAGGIGQVATEEPACPVMLHFGEEDSHIGQDQVEAVRKAHPEVQVYTYPAAGHAFNRDADPAAYVQAAAILARDRTLAFLAKNLG